MKNVLNYYSIYDQTRFIIDNKENFLELFGLNKYFMFHQ